MPRYLANSTLRRQRLKKMGLVLVTVALAIAVGALGPALDPRGRLAATTVAMVAGTMAMREAGKQARAWERTDADNNFSTDHFADGRFVHMTRFSKMQLQRLMVGMGLPAEMRTASGVKFSAIEGLTVLLTRYAHCYDWDAICDRRDAPHRLGSTHPGHLCAHARKKPCHGSSQML